MANETVILPISDEFKFDGHNPDSQCVACCNASIQLENFLDTLEGLLAKVMDPNAVEDLPPLVKMAAKILK